MADTTSTEQVDERDELMEDGYPAMLHFSPEERARRVSLFEDLMKIQRGILERRRGVPFDSEEIDELLRQVKHGE